jgi:hypothetical protein
MLASPPEEGSSMTTARAIESRIIRRRLAPEKIPTALRPAERMIAVGGAACLLLMAGSMAPELVFAGLLAAVVVSLI